MDIVKQEILDRALNALRGKLDFIALSVVEADSDSFDAAVSIMNIKFLCVIKEHVTTSSFNSVLNELQAKAATSSFQVLLVTAYISPTLLNQFAKMDMNVLDSVGNCHIRHKKRGRIVFQLSNSGEKNVYEKEKSYPVFLGAGIKVIFYLLNDLENVNKSYREIQEATGVSIGSIKNVVDELIALHYVLVTEKGRFLKNHKKLLEQWVISYNQLLKPKLLLARMTFLDNERRSKWPAMELPEGMYWGGESAAQMVVGYLQPGAFDIYTDIPAANLLRTGFVKQDENGEIGIFRKFWNWNTPDKLVPLVLIYADLMGSGNARCLETAKLLLDNGLKHFK